MQPVCACGLLAIFLFVACLILAVLWRLEAHLLYQEKELTAWLEKRLKEEHKAEWDLWKHFRAE